MLHFLAILYIYALSLRFGMFRNIEVVTHIDEIKERPSADQVTAYSFLKPTYYMKAVA